MWHAPLLANHWGIDSVMVEYSEVYMTNTSVNTKNPAEQEFDATKAVYSALEPLDDDARERVVKHVAGMLEINAAVKPQKQPEVIEDAENDESVVDTAAAAAAAVPAFNNFAEL